MSIRHIHLHRTGQGQPLVFVHGYLGSRHIWRAAIETLSQYFCCYTLDLPGFGENAHLTAPDTIPAFATHLLSSIDNQGLSNCYLIGHSMGGQIAQQMTLLRPDLFSKLVLYGTGPKGSMPGRFETIAQSRNRLQSEGVTVTAHTVSATWFLEYEKSDNFGWVSALAKDISIQTADNCLAAMEKWDVRDQLHKIQIPTCVVWGDTDRSYAWTEQQTLWSQIPNANLAVIPCAAHAAHLDSPDIFSSLVRSWLSE